MATRDGRSIFTLARDVWTRKVQSTNDSGSVGFNIPSELADDLDITAGDDVAVERADTGEDCAFKVHTKPNE